MERFQFSYPDEDPVLVGPSVDNEFACASFELILRRIFRFCSKLPECSMKICNFSLEDHRKVCNFKSTLRPANFMRK